MNNVTVSLTSSGWDLIGQALDIAVKSGGVGAAESLLPIYQEIRKQVREAMAPQIAMESTTIQQ